jgi:hypothetical protein
MKKATARKALPAGVAKVLERLHYPLDVILLCVRWYVAYPQLTTIHRVGLALSSFRSRT